MNDMQNKFKGDKALTLSIGRWSGEDIPFMNFELHWTNDPQPKVTSKPSLFTISIGWEQIIM